MVAGYHYTNEEAFRSIQGGWTYGKTGLLPIGRFAHLGIGGMPSEAHEGIIEGLLEPEPASWTFNPEFPRLWRYLVHDFCISGKDIKLLSFDLTEED